MERVLLEVGSGGSVDGAVAVDHIVIGEGFKIELMIFCFFLVFLTWSLCFER